MMKTWWEDMIDPYETVKDRGLYELVMAREGARLM